MYKFLRKVMPMWCVSAMFVAIVMLSLEVVRLKSESKEPPLQLMRHMAENESHDWDDKFRHGYGYAISVLAGNDEAVPMPRGKTSVTKHDGTIVTWAIGH